MTSGLAIFTYVCLYLAIGFALAVGGMKGKFTTYHSDDFEDTFTRGIACLGIGLFWPIMGTIIVLGRIAK